MDTWQRVKPHDTHARQHTLSGTPRTHAAGEGHTSRAAFRAGSPPSPPPGEREPEPAPGGPGVRVLPAATMTEGALAADEVRVPLGAPPPSPAAAVGTSPESPGAPGREAERGSRPVASPPESPAAERGAELGADEEQPVPYPALAATVFFCLGQTTRPRSWCLRLVCNPYPSRAGGARGSGTRDPFRVRSRAPWLVGPGAGLARGGAGQGHKSPALRKEMAVWGVGVGTPLTIAWGITIQSQVRTELERV
ncbi:Hypothetical predicted protein [Marmota monax]|uniref:Uncharacterized protein n=1 Tax=Marmota monax TaxID=9995 RepID=A0A5E4AYM3_MARMO|nr:hypothetical protein GHT09_016740 [Marmota monax]VTJ61821.1 Hypothetical predicted protein [Marmota monax]